MALSWDIGSCERQADLIVPHPKGVQLQPWVQIIVLYTPALGIGLIDKNRVGEFFERLTLHDTLFAPLGKIVRELEDGTKKDMPQSIAYEMLERVVGLRTNVPYEKPVPWTLRLVKGFREGVRAELTRQKEEAAEVAAQSAKRQPVVIPIADLIRSREKK